MFEPVATESCAAVKSSSPCVSPSPELQKVLDTPVGSQKRKARKNKITHLVRTADGRVSPAEGELNHCFLLQSFIDHFSVANSF